MCRTECPWQAHALQRMTAAPPGPRPAPNKMEWTQRPDCGPGAEILGDLRNRNVLELGCGAGHNLAHLAVRRGAAATGVDRADRQIQRCRAHYGHFSTTTFVAQGALAYLHATQTTFDAVYSVFGAIGLTDPAPLLEAAAARLTGGGLLAFSIPHPRRRGRRPANRACLDHIGLPDRHRLPVLRWELTAERWCKTLTAAGLAVTDARDISAPEGGQWPTTLLILARKP
ncbi:class I SAM-dependent methyltransferase [Actinoallomurus sp. NPDC052274]|uniref:class I SAM-dependent methyltransferase n=1 Tax=Actinoallomurus sp. NPDC052274 TaxID=3155420 RepID=UPI00342408AD